MNSSRIIVVIELADNTNNNNNENEKYWLDWCNGMEPILQSYYDLLLENVTTALVYAGRGVVINMRGGKSQLFYQGIIYSIIMIFCKIIYTHI